MDKTINRRDFLKFSAAGSAVLATGSSLALLTGCSSNEGPAKGYHHFRQQDVTLLTPLVGAVLGSALSAVGASAEDGLHAFDELLKGGMPGTRDAVFQVLDLMQLGAVRWYITGTWASFADQSVQQLEQTLSEWSASERTLSRMAFKGLTQPIFMAWYTQPEPSRMTGYPGPPRNLAV